MVDFVPGHAVIDDAQCKRGKYMAKCAAIGYGFLPFSFSSLGELEADAVTLLKRIRKFSMAQDIGTRAIMQYRDEEWRVVGRNRDMYGDRRATEKHEAIDKVSVSYYITNLLKDIQPRDIWNRCARIGTIVDVYVEQKLSKMGRGFGFMRFIRIKDTKEVGKRLCDIWFGNYHVFASVARFKRKKSNMNKQDYRVNQKEDRDCIQQDEMRNWRSYWKTVSEEKPKIVEQVQKIRSMITEKKELTGLTEVSSTILAEVREPTSLLNLMNLCCEEVVQKFRPLSSEFVVNERLVWLEINEDESNSLAIGKVGKEGSFYNSENSSRHSEEDEQEINHEQSSECGEYVPNTFGESNKDTIQAEKGPNFRRYCDEKVDGEQDNMGCDRDGHNKRNEECEVEKLEDGNNSEEGEYRIELQNLRVIHLYHRDFVE
ncbi:RNA-directed DNA polymerase, eukaryota [Tanacetum coccineum]